eukprot:TRINITY_DN42160_c0_g1_i1.p1 TRINITY_DN42160_c0_g1~~TRINITY_DN42160_c0_g1_i1.p1  ORF type:complete len:119 (-),score=16.06 TRINITY_DN42160_c0_g1_i1:34-390(-)
MCIRDSRKGHTSAVVDTNYNATEVYIFGGIDNEGQYRDDMFILNMDGTITNITTSPGNRPSRRAYHASAVMHTEYEGTLIFIHGGTDGSEIFSDLYVCLLYTSPSPRDRTRSRMPSSA